MAASDRYRFVHGDICDAALVDALLAEEQPDAIVHFAAESHVDRSILSPAPVVQTNFRGTFTLLEAAQRNARGALRARLDRRSVRQPGGAARGRRGLSAEPEQPVLGVQGRLATCWRAPTSSLTSCRCVITRASNNYGPYQFPEKLIPLMITQRAGRPAAAGLRRRHAGARLAVRGRSLPRHPGRAATRAATGEIYNIGGNRSLPNLEVVRTAAGADRKAGEPDQVRDGSSGARPPLRALQRKADARNRLGARRGF